MNIFSFNKPQSNISTTWRDTLIARENKKVALQSVDESEQSLHMHNAIAVNDSPKIICTHESFKRNGEDNQKIRQVHEELETLSVSPRLAF